jgi:hypothetical protein
MRFGTWNVRSMYRAGSLITVAEEIPKYKLIFLIGIVGGGGVQVGPLGTAATNRPIVPAPGDYGGGEIGGIIGRGNRCTWRNLAQFRFVHHEPHKLPGCEPGTRRWEASDYPKYKLDLVGV